MVETAINWKASALYRRKLMSHQLPCESMGHVATFFGFPNKQGMWIFIWNVLIFKCGNQFYLKQNETL